MACFRICMGIAGILVATLLTAILIVLCIMLLNLNYFLCKNPYKIIPRYKVCDKHEDCSFGQDEKYCVKSIRFDENLTLIGVRLSKDRSTLQVINRHTKSWSSACFDDFTEAWAKIACTQMGYHSMITQPTFQAVKIGPQQQLPVKKITVQNQEFQVKEYSGPCLSKSLVSLHCSVCGKNQQGSPRVIGGHDASVKTWPWQVSLQYKRTHICGGAILSHYWILSASHCFKNQYDLFFWKVKVGIDHLTSKSPWLDLDKIFIITLDHSFPDTYDMAMIKLKKPLVMSDTIRPICLPFFDEELAADTPVWVIGWGSIKAKEEKTSPILQQAQVYIVDRVKCSMVDMYRGHIGKGMLCAGVPEGGIDACQGDSGGPLMYFEKKWKIVGIVSWGFICGEPGIPGVYTHVSFFLNWIYNTWKK